MKIFSDKFVSLVKNVIENQIENSNFVSISIVSGHVRRLLPNIGDDGEAWSMFPLHPTIYWIICYGPLSDCYQMSEGSHLCNMIIQRKK